MNYPSFLPYARHAIDDSDRQAVQQVLLSQTLTRGPEVRMFEEELASFVGAPYAVAFSSGSAALEAAYAAASISAYDTVISTPNTFIATVAPAKKAGAGIELVDIDIQGNIDLEQAIEKINAPRTRGRAFFVPVHFGGVPVDMQTVSEQIIHPDVVIIEDAAHALGSSYEEGLKVGSCAYSDMTVFSFHPAKNITTGEGGAVTCQSEDVYRALRRLRDSGIERENVFHAQSGLGYYEVPQLSSNYHLSEMHAALGRSQLKRIDSLYQKKQVLIRRYMERLKRIPGVTSLLGEVSPLHHHHLFVVTLAFETFGLTREQLMQKLHDKGIGTQFHYVPLYYHDALRLFPKNPEEIFPLTERYFQTGISLPFFSSMHESDVDRVLEALYQVLFGA